MRSRLVIDTTAVACGCVTLGAAFMAGMLGMDGPAAALMAVAAVLYLVPALPDGRF